MKHFPQYLALCLEIEEAIKNAIEETIEGATKKAIEEEIKNIRLQVYQK